MEKALGSHFDSTALQNIIAANLAQDAVRYQFGHDHYHYDNNSFAAGDAYVNELRGVVFASLDHGDGCQAQDNFGRLTHTVQDLYAHSNYVSLWRQLNPGAPASEIDPLVAGILSDPRLRSGRLYYPLEILSFFSFSKPFVLPLLPRDSHAWMNLDDPSRQNFDFAFEVAVKRSILEYSYIIDKLSPQQAGIFTGNNIN